MYVYKEDYKQNSGQRRMCKINLRNTYTEGKQSKNSVDYLSPAGGKALRSHS